MRKCKIQSSVGERQGIAQKGVRAIEGERPQLEMAKVLQKPVFVLQGCQQINVNTLFVWYSGAGWLGVILGRAPDTGGKLR